ncbi:hypothetical protein CSKR_203497 [Clonorchis sinensis]|uniref:Uncharacterized protein n=1 Tax=Clonorchis sinensis TaxID=79923 RepID=A0A8T1MAU2_CLOSI|nr:hypothetical protein CSKR_203497 [Clonorchis sinensis]
MFSADEFKQTACSCALFVDFKTQADLALEDKKPIPETKLFFLLSTSKNLFSRPTKSDYHWQVGRVSIVPAAILFTLSRLIAHQHQLDVFKLNFRLDSRVYGDELAEKIGSVVYTNCRSGITQSVVAQDDQ